MKKLDHLSEIYSSYDTFIIDLWGVMHNGITLYKDAIEAVKKLNLESKKVVFLSNAPRPSSNVKDFLRNMKMDDKYLNNIVTSGEAAMYSINQNKFGKSFFHLGPERDEPIFAKIKKNKTEIAKSDFILCTGLFDEHENDLNFYRDLLKEHISKKLICTNPDLIVHRGKEEEYCAGFIAQIFESLGGKVVYFGKPHKEIYEMCFSNKEKVLAIGDNLRTDIKGANNLKIDSIFILNGVHINEIENEDQLNKLFKKYNVKPNYYQTTLNW